MKNVSSTMKHCGTHSFWRLHYWSQFFTFLCILKPFAICLRRSFHEMKCISLNFRLGHMTWFVQWKRTGAIRCQLRLVLKSHQMTCCLMPLSLSWEEQLAYWSKMMREMKSRLRPNLQPIAAQLSPSWPVDAWAKWLLIVVRDRDSLLCSNSWPRHLWR